MSRTSNNEYRDGLLFDGYDYTRQAWVVDGKYVTCGHSWPNPLTGKTTPCDCYGRAHQGEASLEPEPIAARKTEAEMGYPLQEQIANAKRTAKNTARRERNQAMRDLGLKRVKGALGGIYWE